MILDEKLRLTTGETAALRAAAMAERWRNMAGVSIEDAVVVRFVGIFGDFVMLLGMSR